MKRIIALLLILTLVFSFSACSKPSNIEETTATGGGTTKIGASCKVTFTEDNGGTGTYKNQASIPEFSVNGESDAINAINARIDSELKSFCTEMANDPWDYAVVQSQSFDTEKYMQVVCTYGKGLSSSMNGFYVTTYVYDKENDKELTLDEAYTMFEYTDASAKRLALQYYENMGELTDIKVQGFYINKSNIIEFFAKTFVNDGETEFIETLTIIPETQDVTPLEDGQVIVKE